jgi:DegV family protein with EDD domain
MTRIPRICILTDSTAQFITPVFSGSEYVNVVPIKIRINDKVLADGKDLKTASLDSYNRPDPGPVVLAPTADDFVQTFQVLEKKYQEIIGVFSSAQLSGSYELAKQAAESARNSAAIHIIDSQTTSVGLGLLVQMAAQSVHKGLDGAAISRTIRGLLPRIYTIFCIQSLAYLSNSGHLDRAQAIVGDMLGIIPLYVLENGRLVAVQKIRNSRQLVDMMSEFLSEFGRLKHIAIIHGSPFYEQEAKLLRERVIGSSAGLSVSEHPLNLALATSIGPRALLVIALEYTRDLD